jgi:hypothetical protein
VKEIPLSNSKSNHGEIKPSKDVKDKKKLEMRPRREKLKTQFQTFQYIKWNHR